jgi:aminoglycoside phosphotransferase (APT) family kinase protein
LARNAATCYCTMDMDSQPGRRIGSGRHADVYDIGDGLVLRRYRDGDRDTAAQAAAMRAARDGGFPVPAVISSGGRDLVMQRVDGPTMLDQLARNPWRVIVYATMLANLHRRLHAIRAPATLERPFGDGVQLLHLDLQPENVVLSTDMGPVVLDWEWAAAGPPSADVAHTWLELATSEIPGPAWRRTMGTFIRAAFVRSFLRRVDREEAETVMPLVRQYRLSRRVLTAHERRTIEAMH